MGVLGRPLSYVRTLTMTSGFYLGTCFLGEGEDGKGEVRPRGLPPRKMLACLYPHTSIHQCLLHDRQGLYQCHILQLGNI